MALKKCRECEQKVSSKAKTCPHCGAPVRASNSQSCLGCTAFLTIVVLGILFFRLYRQDFQPTPKRPDPFKRFQQVGYFKSDGLRGFTYYVAGANRKDIAAFCAKERKSYEDLRGPRGHRTLKIHFFDDRNHTPDVSLKYYFPDSCHSHMVADYFHNPNNGAERLLFLNALENVPSEIPTPSPHPAPR